MVWIVLMVVFLPVSALGADLVIPTTPPQVEVQDVKSHLVSYGFQEEAPGRFQLQANLRYRRWTSPIERVKQFTFRLEFGTIVQRDDQTLVLRHDNRERVVGRHRWWYSPYWQASYGARITCDRDRRISKVVLKNCRLIVPRFENRDKEMNVAFHDSGTQAVGH